MTGRVRPAVALLLVALVGTMLWWPVGVAAAVPVAVADPGMVVQKDAAATSLDVLANDTHDALTSEISATTTPASGTVAIDSDGQGVTYDPDQDFIGTDTFDYTIHDTDDPGSDSTATVTVKVNAPPVAVDDPASPGCNPHPTDFGGTFPVPEDYGQLPLFGPCGLRANDTDVDGTVVDWEMVTAPSHGVLQYIDSDFFGYTPNADYSTLAGDQPGGEWVSDSFTYRSKDSDGAWSQPATMRYWVAPVNDAPTFVSPPTQVEVAEDSGAHDESWVPYASPGPPNESDQTIDFVVTQVNTYGLANMFSGPPTFTAGGHLTFTPGPNECGVATITVHLHDHGGLENYGINNLPDPPDDTSDPITFDILVDCANDTPVAAADSTTVAEDSGATSVPVRSNDTDADPFDTLTITGKTNGTHGTVVITGGGTGLTYKPNANAFGSDNFTYTISDGHGGSATATVNVTITPGNDAPNAINDGVPTTIKIGTGAGPVPIAVLANDTSSPDGAEILRITAVTQGSNGTVAIIDRGTRITYDPAGTTTGIDVFHYTISDGHGGIDTADVQVQVATDATGPVVGAPKVSATRLLRPGTARLVVSWVATDPESGIASSQLQLKRDGAATWTTVPLAHATATRTTMLVATGHTYRFQVRATNGIGQTSTFRIGALVSV